MRWIDEQNTEERTIKKLREALRDQIRSGNIQGAVESGDRVYFANGFIDLRQLCRDMRK